MTSFERGHWIGYTNEIASRLRGATRIAESHYWGSEFLSGFRAGRHLAANLKSEA